MNEYMKIYTDVSGPNAKRTEDRSYASTTEKTLCDVPLTGRSTSQTGDAVKIYLDKYMNIHNRSPSTENRYRSRTASQKISLDWSPASSMDDLVRMETERKHLWLPQWIP